MGPYVQPQPGTMTSRGRKEGLASDSVKRLGALPIPPKKAASSRDGHTSFLASPS